MVSNKYLDANAAERWPWFLRLLTGFAAACSAEAITYLFHPLRSFPLLLGFPIVVLCAWFLGSWAGVVCALAEESFVDSQLTQPQFRLAMHSTREELRMAIFLVLSVLLGWTIRQLAARRSRFQTERLLRQLESANAERVMIEERLRAKDAIRERDDLLQLAIQANGMALWVWDLTTNTFEWSDEVYKMAGVEPSAIPPTYEAWRALVHPDDLAQLDQAISKTQAEGVDFRMQYRLICSDGSVSWLESQGKCQRDRDGNATRVLGVLTNITHRKRTEEAILRTEKLSIAGRLAASVAHEINNPLASVTNLLFLVTLAESVDQSRNYATMALEELDKVAKITQQTLQFSRQNPIPAVTHLSAVMEGVAGIFRGKLKRAKVQLEVRVPAETEVLCVSGEIQQILANLVSNAIDAMPEGGRLVVRIRPSRDWRDYKTEGMRITVSDSGTGMDRETMRRVTEPFFSTKAESGTGLGMWIVAELLSRHRGGLKVWSAQKANPSGTAFSIFLPLDAKKDLAA